MWCGATLLLSDPDCTDLMISNAYCNAKTEAGHCHIKNFTQQSLKTFKQDFQSVNLFPYFCILNSVPPRLRKIRSGPPFQIYRQQVFCTVIFVKYGVGFHHLVTLVQ